MRKEWTRTGAEGVERGGQAGELETHGTLTSVPGDHFLGSVNQSLFLSLSHMYVGSVCLLQPVYWPGGPAKPLAKSTSAQSHS